jgi:hypothetical protein
MPGFKLVDIFSIAGIGLVATGTPIKKPLKAAADRLLILANYE